jgi:hypothetical protein
MGVVVMPSHKRQQLKTAARIKRGDIKGVATYSPMLCTPVRSANVKLVQSRNASLCSAVVCACENSESSLVAAVAIASKQNIDIALKQGAQCVERYRRM